MRRAVPLISEHVAELTQRLQHEHDGRKKPRLQMLYLLASGQAQTRQQVATLLGIHRNTVGHWLASYETGGRPAVLDISIPLGKPVSLAPEVLLRSEHALRHPAGVVSYEALRQWVEHTHHVRVKYQTLSMIVRTKCKAKRKVPRPSHPKKG